MKSEGFWFSQQEPFLSKPVPNSWSDQEASDFINLLHVVESKSRIIRYKGWSNCRICGKMNGSEEFNFIGAWRWPEGLWHYIKIHLVQPSSEFQQFILNNS